MVGKKFSEDHETWIEKKNGGGMILCRDPISME